MLEQLRRQGVSEELLQQVLHYRKKHSVSASPQKIDPPYLYDGREVWEQSITALLAGENLLLVGPKATGKNVLAENLADLFERPHRTISFHVNSDANTLLGSDTFRNGQVEFRPGPIYQVAKEGGFGILDEINMARNDAIAVLHATLDYRRQIDLPGAPAIQLAPETRFIATMNEGYLGTRELNEALTSRFMVIQVPTIGQEALERLIFDHFPSMHAEYPRIFSALFEDLHQKNGNGEISSKSVDLRGLLGALRLMQHGLSPRLALDMGLTNKSFDPYEQELVRDVIALRIPKKLSFSSLFPKEEIPNETITK